MIICQTQTPIENDLVGLCCWVFFFTYVPMQTTVIYLILLTFDNQFISVLKETTVIMNNRMFSLLI